jgi:type VI secretion system protein ImpE
MTNAELSFESGDLAGCLEALQSQLRRTPTDSKARIFLCELLMVLGQWARAVQQLELLMQMDATHTRFALTYKAAIECERARLEVFKGAQKPLVRGSSRQWIEHLLEALALLTQGEVQAAAARRATALDAAYMGPGTINEIAFDWIADLDSRLGPVLEIFIEGQYHWVPLDEVHVLTGSAPENVRDFVWNPCRVVWKDGSATVGLMPTRYPGTETCGDWNLMLARGTTWTDLGESTYQGLGQRLFAADRIEVSVLELRELRLQN